MIVATDMSPCHRRRGLIGLPQSPASVYRSPSLGSDCSCFRMEAAWQSKTLQQSGSRRSHLFSVRPCSFLARPGLDRPVDGEVFSPTTLPGEAYLYDSTANPFPKLDHVALPCRPATGQPMRSVLNVRCRPSGYGEQGAGPGATRFFMFSEAPREWRDAPNGDAGFVRVAKVHTLLSPAVRSTFTSAISAFRFNERLFSGMNGTLCS